MNVLLETVKTLRREAFEKLRSVELIKKKQIESYFEPGLQGCRGLGRQRGRV